MCSSIFQQNVVYDEMADKLFKNADNMRVFSPKDSENWPARGDGSKIWPASLLGKEHFDVITMTTDEVGKFCKYLQSFGPLEYEEFGIGRALHEMWTNVDKSTRLLLHKYEGRHIVLPPACVVTVMHFILYRIQ